ncbi:hypothetical protein QTO34_014571 [Cnephaeus nilssonii]|uniref:Mannosyltransferase n=1 Tax=Cnephaeus nilssonii TaxID=3371016 RepID=A0AA40I6L6_CNENI|nr:hypothetical protein QTO34_014571 [Eptesicus nilssonii]
MSWQLLDLKMAPRVLWGSLSLLRLLWCLLPQTGYVHPDEFFQSPEVMAEDILGIEGARPWEFHPSSSCRTVVFPLLTSGFAFWLLKLWKELGPWPGLVSGYMLLVGPRLLLTALSFALDVAVYHLAPLWRAERWNALVLLSGSYVTLVFYTRTFSNAIEGLLFAWLLVLVSPRVARSPAPKKPAPGSWWHSWLLGSILAAGFFNRPTFLAFALVPVFLWGIRGATDSAFKSLTKAALGLLPGATLTAAVFVVVDSWYFSSLLTDQPNTLVLTPANFLQYNLDPQNLERHGTHLRLTHLALNGFLLFGMLHAQALRAGWQQLRVCLRALAQMRSLRVWDAQRLLPGPSSHLLFLYFTPLALLSAFSHQEARFLIPLIVPLVLLCSPQTQPVPCKGTLVLFNALGALFFGCLHQGASCLAWSTWSGWFMHLGPTSHPWLYFLGCRANPMPNRHLYPLPRRENSVHTVRHAGRLSWVDAQPLSNSRIQVACSLGGSSPNTQSICVVTNGTTKYLQTSCSFGIIFETYVQGHLSLNDPLTSQALVGHHLAEHLSMHLMVICIFPKNYYFILCLFLLDPSFS